MADTLDLGSSAERCAGSSPVSGTNSSEQPKQLVTPKKKTSKTGLFSFEPIEISAD